MRKNLERDKQTMNEFIKLIREVDDAMIDSQLLCLPHEWQRLDKHVPPKPYKKAVTFYFDEAMLREYRKLGVNWQSHVRVILAGYMKLAKAGLLPSREMDM